MEELTRTVERGSAVVLACPGTTEGVLAAVGAAYLAHADPDLVRLERRDLCQPRFGEEVVEVDEGERTVALARRVFDGFEARAARDCGRTRGGSCPATCDYACARRIIFACANDAPEMPEAVHRYLRLGFSRGVDVRDMLSHPDVVAFDALARRVSNECEHTRQFVRFSRLTDGSFFASFRPAANTVPLTSGYFAARMRQDRFCLADPTHGLAAFHEKGRRGCSVIALDDVLMERLLEQGQDVADEERYVREMWRTFYRSMELGGRDASQRGYDLRASWMPKRFWGGLTELIPEDAGHKETPAPQRYQDTSSAALP